MAHCFLLDIKGSINPPFNDMTIIGFEHEWGLLVAQKYCMVFLIFPQLPISVAFTLVLRNPATNKIPVCSLLLSNMFLEMIWCASAAPLWVQFLCNLIGVKHMGDLRFLRLACKVYGHIFDNILNVFNHCNNHLFLMVEIQFRYRVIMDRTTVHHK